jgi:hypothetical protein
MVVQHTMIVFKYDGSPHDDGDDKDEAGDKTNRIVTLRAIIWQITMVITVLWFYRVE